MTSSSLSGLVSTLVPTALLAGVYLVAFLILRRSHNRYYAPRTYLGSVPESERSPALPSGLFNWVGSFWKMPDVYALQHQSLDAYLFLRFLRMTVVISFVGCCITWPVLFPVYATGGGGQSQLNLLSYSNIDRSTQKNRYYAPVFMSWVYYGFVMYLIMRECIYYINLRQAFLISPGYASRLSSRTVLFTSVPETFLDEARLRKMFGDTAKKIWLFNDLSEVDDLVGRRDKAAFRLEKAEVKLIKLANKARQKAIKKGNANADGSPAADDADAESGSIAAHWIPNKDRPTHRLGKFGLVGKKVDSIDWCRTELSTLIPAVDAAQAKYKTGSGKKIPAVFIEFRTQSEAECASQIVAHHEGLHMSQNYVGIKPEEIVWKSLSIPWWQKVIRRYAVLAFITAMIIFWAIPVAVVGAISNVTYLEQISFLTWLKDIPSVIMGVVTGLLPSVALSILMSLVPIVMRLCAKLAGEPSLSRVELFTQNSYFAFQVIQVFLVTTLASAATAVAREIVKNPSSATTILSQNLPQASNFYISYFIVQGLTIASQTLAQVTGFVIFALIYKYLSGTPRALYNKWTNLSAISWGSTLPVYTNIAVIGITYAGIAPLMLGFSTIGMGLFYLAYKYNILFVTDTQIDTRGLIYPRALKQLFTGIYLSQVCMVGLFGASVAIGPLVLMIAALVFTVLFHISLNNALDPLLYNLPLSLLSEEEIRLAAHKAETVAAETGAAPGSNGHNGALPPQRTNSTEKTLAAAQADTKPKTNILTRFLKPWVSADHDTLRLLAPDGPTDFDSVYPEDVANDAYYPPAATSSTPLLWIPRDLAGVSRQEIAHTNKIIPITDEGCELNEKGKLVWDEESTRPPVWEEKVLY